MINPEAIPVMVLRFTQYPIQKVKYPLFSLAKQPEPEADYSSLSSAAVMNEWSCDSIPHVPSCCAQVQI